jgi:hypothetical protein
MTDWTITSRYAAYCRDHSKTPEEMKAYDAGRYRGGPNAGFEIWGHSKMAEWRGTVGMREDAPLSVTDQMDFDAWLDA